MVDVNLPTFYIKKNTERKHYNTIYLTHRGSDPEPAYSLRYPDPCTPESKNRYAVALFDPYVPDVIYGEVLLIPEWTRPSLSAEAIRQNGGVPPPPEPILPSKFVIQLYNPDQQVTLHYKHKTWNSPATWEFEMPQRTFRQPSVSTLDRTQSDPAVADFTPKLKFSWRKDGKLTKDLSCVLSGKTTILPESKAKSREPDITISFFRSFREITLYEPNLYRVEMEDFKGLEVVLLLGAVAIRDVFFSHIKDAFNVCDPPTGSSPVRSSSVDNKPVASGPLNGATPTSPDRLQRPRITIPESDDTPVEAEDARLRRQQGLEAQEEQRRTRKLLEAEEKARRKKQAEIDKETKRLQKLYGEEDRKVLEQQQQRRRSSSSAQSPQNSQNQPSPPRGNHHGRHHSTNNLHAYHHPHAMSVTHLGLSSGPYLQAPGHEARAQSSIQLMQPPHLSACMHSNNRPTSQVKKKSSFLGFLKSPDEENKLSKKRSSMF